MLLAFSNSESNRQKSSNPNANELKYLTKWLDSIKKGNE